MKSSKEWTPDEEVVLFDQVRRHSSMMEGFRKASEILEDRTVSACKQHWYHLSNSHFIPLQDRIAVSQPKEHYSIWDRIKIFLKRIF